MRFLALCLLITSFSVSAKTLSIMNYNLENLFDTKHDEGKLDFTYLPKKLKDSSPKIQKYCKSIESRGWRDECFNLDWNQDVVNAKMRNLGRVVKAAMGGKGADILVFQEVENKSVLTEFVKKELKGLGYKYISLIEGDDARGIDVGMVSRYPITNEVLHKISLGDEQGQKLKTRGILEVTFKVNGKLVTIFGNHWPSQGNPDTHRLRASEILLEKAQQAQGDLVVATGDFNTLPSDFPHGLNRNIKPAFYDLEEEARAYVDLHPGTHWYKGEWSSLDRMFVLKSSVKSNISINFNQFEIAVNDFALGPYNWTDYGTGRVTVYQGVPKRFNPKTKEGYSDHLPLIATFEL